MFPFVFKDFFGEELNFEWLLETELTFVFEGLTFLVCLVLLFSISDFSLSLFISLFDESDLVKELVLLLDGLLPL